MRRLQTIVKLAASTGAGAWFFGHAAHRLDLFVINLSKGRSSLTSIFAGLPVITLTTIGAKSGQLRTVPLVGIPDGEKVVLFASNFGRAHHPAWYHNLRANPEATLSFRGRAKAYIAREATGPERASYWQEAVRLYAGYATYKERTKGREIPVMLLTPKDDENPITILE